MPGSEATLLQAACARRLQAISAQEVLAGRYGYRPARGAGEAGRDLPCALQYGRYGSVVEADLQGCFDHLDPGWLRERRRWRMDDRAFPGLIRQWVQAGIPETDGRVRPPDPGTPPGGGVSPVVANVYVHSARDLWCAKGGKPHWGGEAWRSRDAEDLGGAFRCRSEAAWFSQARPQRLGTCTREVAPEKTRSLRCSRFRPGMQRRFPLVGGACFWKADRQGVPRVTRRPARKKLQRACRRSKEGMQAHRHVPGTACFQGRTARLRGQYRDDGVHGNAHALSRFLEWATQCACKGRNRRGGKRRRVSWARCPQRLDAVNRERPRRTEGRRRRGYA
jgi:hypothetical protein